MSDHRTCVLHPDTGLLIAVEDVDAELYARIVAAEERGRCLWEFSEKSQGKDDSK